MSYFGVPGGARLRLGSAPWPRPDAFPRAARGRFPARPRLGLPGPAIAMARPRTWPGPSGRPLLRVVRAGRWPRVAPCPGVPVLRPRRPLFRPGGGPQVRPLRRPDLDLGPPSGPDGPVCSKPFPAISLHVGSARRGPEPRPDCGVGVRVQTGVTTLLAQRFGFHVPVCQGRGPRAARFARSLPSAPTLCV